VFDAYTLRARLAPVALAALPGLVLLGGGLIAPQHGVSILAIAFAAVAIIACGIVRDLGRHLQLRIWKSWGGSPTLQRLRWRDAKDPTVTERLHRRLKEVTGEPLPSHDDELADPAAADRRYDEAIAALRDLTRNRQEFPLVFEENASYGFRRNCLGIRPVALLVAGLVLALSVALLAVSHDAAEHHAGRFWAAAAVGALALMGWWQLVTPSWVRSAAELYADRLMESVETLRRRGAP
jgi:hypothetical protein